MSQYLGDISAYALAVSQGYTGTEEEYAELMASYATVGQTAVTAAQTATTKATEAATSATTATNKATEATTAATTATNKAAEAQADADAAALDASQALSAASTATTKATEAITAAATAVSAKDDAVSANTAAQSAKTAAQTAQTGAETAAASVEASAEQIATNAADISQLKSELYSGKVIKWNQLAKSAQNWTMNWRAGVVTTGDDEITVTNAPSNYYSYNGVSGTVQVGHKYLFLCYAKATNAKACMHIEISGVAVDKLTDSSEYVLLSSVETGVQYASPSFSYRATLRCQNSNSGSVSFKHPKVFDLTMMGLEDVTVEEFVNMFPDWESAEQDTTGTEISLTKIDILKNDVYQLAPDMTLSHKTILLCGDSRSSTDYTFYKSTLDKKTNGFSETIGGSGWSTAQIASDAYFERLAARANHDFALYLVGGNDTGASGTVGTFSATSPNGLSGEPVVEESDLSHDFYTGSGTEPDYNDGVHQSAYFIVAVDHIIRKYKSLFYDFKTLDNGHKPKLIFLTGLPQKRIDANNAYSKPENWERKRQAVIEACEKNGVDYIDTMVKCNFDMSYEPYYIPPTDMKTNNGLYYMDGVHPNQYGIDVVTSIEVEEMKKYISINPYLTES